MTPAEFRAARHRLGLSQAQMARALGVADRQQIRRYELPPEASTHRDVPAYIARAVELLELLSTRERQAYFTRHAVLARAA